MAHSGYPPKGVLHLDADEMWSFDGSDGVDLRYVSRDTIAEKMVDLPQLHANGNPVCLPLRLIPYALAKVVAGSAERSFECGMVNACHAMAEWKPSSHAENGERFS